MFWRGDIGRPTGYAEAARGYLKALALVGYKDVLLRPLAAIQWATEPYSSRENQLLAAFRGVDAASCDRRVWLVHSDPTSAARHSVRGLYNICLTVWETDRLPGDARFGLNGWFRELWVPSTHNRDVFKASGVTRPVHVVPHALWTSPEDIAPFRERPPQLEGRYVFYFIGSRNARKNPLGVARAFIEEFDQKDPVTLVLKTWTPAVWSPAGGKVVFDPLKLEIARLAESLGKDPRALPQIVCIEREMTRADVLRLHAAGDCYVSAHRGEGFGLAILEARALGRPVIATAWGGPCDFLDFEGAPERDFGRSLDLRVTPTDIGVPYDLVPVEDMEGFRAGFDPGQKWAEPSALGLRAAMRTCFEEHRRNVGPGRTGDFHPWAIGERMVDLLETAKAEAGASLKWKGGAAQARPRVVLMSSFNEECGIAVYAENLTRALLRRGVKVEVAAPIGSADRGLPEDTGVPFQRVWRRGSADLSWLSGPPGILHVQHEFSFWLTEGPLVEMLAAAKKAGWQTVVTLHTVMPAGLSLASFYKSVCHTADYVTAVGFAGVEALRGWCKLADVDPVKVRLTQNCCASAPWVDRRAVRVTMGLTDFDLLCVTPGFVSPMKRIGDILLGVEKALAAGLNPSKFHLVIAGGDHGDDNNRKYVESLVEGINVSPALSSVVSLQQGYRSDAEYARLLAAADIGILFHSPVVISSSAVALDVLRFGLPSISGDCPALELLSEAVSLKVSSPDEIAAALVRLVGDADLRQKLAAASRDTADFLQPDNIAAAVDAFYEEVWAGRCKEVAA